MSGTCEICQKQLTLWNRAWGTRKCSSCAKGRSPAAKKHQVYEMLERAPFRSAEEIPKTRLSSLLRRACILLLVVNVGAVAFHASALLAGNNKLFVGELLVFYVGVRSGGKTWFRTADLLDVSRWRSCWHGNVLGYVIGQGLVAFVLPAVQTGAIGKSYLVICMLVSPPLTGLVLAILNGFRAERSNIAKTRECFREWQQSKTHNKSRAQTKTGFDAA